ncbi:hypothetical protein [Mycobacterium sp.]|uniref:hypothetical protein n=1 Tax=Mycobacterium sp. TaxID=1785 RepID=UPI0025CC383F|nr:hypothetical protein [Mycobacterium sp.]
MNQILLASHNGSLYELKVLSEFDVADLVRVDRPEVLSSTDGAIDFWFAHNPRVAVNCGATEMLLASTRFTAHEVPLLRGDVVVATHDAAGKLAGLNDIQIKQLLTTDPSRQETRILARRFSSDRTAQRRQARRDSTEASLKPIRGL